MGYVILSVYLFYQRVVPSCLERSLTDVSTVAGPLSDVQDAFHSFAAFQDRSVRSRRTSSFRSKSNQPKNVMRKLSHGQFYITMYNFHCSYLTTVSYTYRQPTIAHRGHAIKSFKYNSLFFYIKIYSFTVVASPLLNTNPIYAFYI